MSTAIDPRVAQLASDLEELKRRKRERPFDFYAPLPHQVAFHAAQAKERWFVAGNRAGKTVAGAAEVVALITGKAKWWTRGPGEVWCGAVSLQDSEAIQRRAIRALMPPSEIDVWTNERNPAAESMLVTKSGWRVRFKAHSQGRERWQGGSCALVWFDEEPERDVYDEGLTRTLDCRGRVIVTFTPLNGLKWQDAYDRVYAPWLDYQRANPGTKWGQVAPGIHVTTASMSDNPHVPPEEVAALRERYAHRPLMLRVRVGGEWLDISEDAIVPVDKLREWMDEPKGGFARVAAWIDSSFSARETSDRFCVSIAGAAHDGRLHLIEQRFGRFDADERVRVALETLRAHGFPTAYVQRTTPDGEFAHRLNDALIRAGARACVRTWPEIGAVPGKVERAHAFAVMVGAGQVYIRPEHKEFRREAATFPHAEHDDVFDAGMGALMVLVEAPAAAMAVEMLREAAQPTKQGEDADGAWWERGLANDDGSPLWRGGGLDD